jgi:hypothetical protein
MGSEAYVSMSAVATCAAYTAIRTIYSRKVDNETGWYDWVCHLTHQDVYNWRFVCFSGRAVPAVSATASICRANGLVGRNKIWLTLGPRCSRRAISGSEIWCSHNTVREISVLQDDFARNYDETVPTAQPRQHECGTWLKDDFIRLQYLLREGCNANYFENCLLFSFLDKILNVAWNIRPCLFRRKSRSRANLTGCNSWQQ